IRQFMEISDTPTDGLAKVRTLAGRSRKTLDAALAAWDARLARLKIPGDRMRFAPALGHAFDYYDGMTFEVRSESLGTDRQISVGGRYDDLLARLGGRAGRAVGCVVRPWRAFAGGES
ncbi:MAG: ATP phosphoribosyltransferase regulatory subunit, partial [Phenylobacterium sp.]